MRLLTLILCLFVFSCDDDDNPVISPLNDFTSILLTDSLGNSYGYEGIQGNHGTCSSPSLVVMSPPYPNPSATGFSIDFKSLVSREIEVVVSSLHLSNEISPILHPIFDDGVVAGQPLRVTWDATNTGLFIDGVFTLPLFEADDGYYRVRINTDDDTVFCYFNYKKSPPPQ